jgi:hypothetical protein
MTRTSVLVLILAWLLCATLAAGIWLAWAQRAFPAAACQDRRRDASMAWGLGLMGGPLALYAALMHTGFAEHGVLLWPDTCKAHEQ